MATAFDQVKALSPDARSIALAVSMIGDRIRRLTPPDAEDVFQLFRCFLQADSEEDRSAAEEAIWELLSQDGVTVHELDLAATGDDCQDFTKWKDFIREKIRARRDQAGLTQVQLAEKAGLPQSHLSRIESGKHSPSHATLTKIACALGIQVNELDPNA